MDNTLADFMKQYDNNLTMRTEHFHLISIDSDKEIEQAVKDLLNTFEIPKSKWGCYLGCKYSLYQLLIQINKNHPKKANVQIPYVIDLIESKERFLTRSLIATAFLAVVASIVLMIVFPPAYSLFKFLLNPMGGLPFWGLFYTVAAAAWALKQNGADLKKTDFEYLRDACFLSANAFLNVLAYGIWILVTASMTPVVAALFVTASAVNVGKELFYAVQTSLAYKDTLLKDKGSVTEARLKYSYIKHRNAAAINLSASVILFGLMTVWCLIPGGFFFVLGIVTTLITVTYIKSQLNKYSETKVREHLSNRLTEIEELSTNVSYSKIINASHQETVDIKLSNNNADATVFLQQKQEAAPSSITGCMYSLFNGCKLTAEAVFLNRTVAKFF